MKLKKIIEIEAKKQGLTLEDLEIMQLENLASDKQAEEEENKQSFYKYGLSY